MQEQMVLMGQQALRGIKEMQVPQALKVQWVPQGLKAQLEQRVQQELG
jgi:hypothetical protein